MTGRPQAFDRDAVVRAARDVFWEHGYEGASVPDLEAATGLSRSSVYNAFGSKRGLFDAAVENYLHEVVRPLLSHLDPSDVGPDSLVDYLDSLARSLGRPSPDSGGEGEPEPEEPAVRKSAHGVGGRGCLLINAATAPLGDDTGIAESVSSYRRDLADAIMRGVSARHPHRSADGRRRLAEAVTALVVESMVLARVDPAQAWGCLDTARDLVEVIDPDS